MASLYAKLGGSPDTTTDTSTKSSSHTTKKKHNKNDIEALFDAKIDTMTNATTNFIRDHHKDRKASTGTLNRLILVAQALESEVDSRRTSDVSGTKISFSIRMTNMLLLLVVNILIFTGVGKYQAQRDGGYKDLLLTADKWAYSPEYDLPETFAAMQLNGQYLASSITVFLLLSTICLQILHVCSSPSTRITGMCYAFGAVPFSLFVFGLEMHYSTCPWVDEFLIAHGPSSMNAQCAINGWALAGIFSLLSCGLFVSEGLITAFFKSDDSKRNAV